MKNQPSAGKLQRIDYFCQSFFAKKINARGFLAGAIAFCLIVLSTADLRADVVVNVTNPGNTTPGLAASYASLALAITALNAQTAISGPVILTADPGSETAPAGGYVINFTYATTALNNVVITGTTTTTITASAALTVAALNDAIFKIIGSDFVTIQNFTMLENVANVNSTAGTNTMTEWGVALLYASTTNGAQNITIQNNIITLNRTYPNTFGIYSNSTHSATAVTSSVTATTAAGGNENLKVYGNTISNVNMGIVHVGPTAAADQNITADIGGVALSTGNSITNYGTTTTGLSSYANVSGTINGILVRNTKNFNISFNTVSSSNGGVIAGGLNGIQIPSSSVAPTGTLTQTINNNNISLRPGATGIACIGINMPSTSVNSTTTCSINTNDFNTFGHTVGSATGTITFILQGGNPLVQNFNNNTFTNMSVNTTGTITFFSFAPALISGASMGLSGNQIITGFTRTGVGSTTIWSSNASSVNGSSHTINNNILSNITLTGASAFTGISDTDGSSSTNGPIKSISGNTISNITTGAATVIPISANFSGPGTTVNNNTIANITTTNSITCITLGTSNQATTTASGNIIDPITSGGTAVIGISTGSLTAVISKNKIYDLSGTVAGSIVSGIAVVNTTTSSTVTVANNLVGNLTAPAATGTNAVIGINITGAALTSNYNVYYNTIYLTGGGGTNFGSSGISAAASTTATTSLLNLNNNIFVNNTTPNGTGLAVAYRRSSGIANSLNNYSSTSNNNLFFTGVAGGSANQLIYSDGTSTAQTIAAYKAGVFTAGTIAPRDAASFSENPNFLSTTGSSGTFLHINTVTPTSIESGGANIAGFTDDFDNNIRAGNGGYPAQVNGGGTAPDVGADEFDGFPLPLCSGAPTASTITGPAAVCTGTGTNLGLSVIYTQIGISYQWGTSSTPGGPYTNLGTTANQASGILTVPAYYVCTVTCSFGSSYITPEKSILINPLPSVMVSPTSGSVCTPGGIPVPLTASGASTYTWSPTTGLTPTSGSPVSANPVATTVYTVTGTDVNGCTNTAATTITVAGTPQMVTATATPPTICTGTSTNLSSTGYVPATVNNYMFSTSTGAALDPMVGATTVVSSSTDDTPMNTSVGANTTPGPSLALPFTFNYDGTNFTFYSASPDGWIVLKNTNAAATSQFTNATVNASNTPKIYPYWDDLATGTTGSVKTLTTGSAPNRIFIVEWFVTIPRATGGVPNSTFQAWLYETTNMIEFRYGTMGVATGSSSGGLSNGTLFNSLTFATNTASNSSANDAQIGVPASGRMYTFATSPPLSYAWSPALDVVSPGSQNTATNNLSSTTTFTVTVTNSGCSSTASATVTIDPLVCTPATTSAACDNFNFTVTAHHTGGGAPFNYSWDDGMGGSYPNTQMITANLPAGMYTFTATVSDACGSMCTSSVIVNVHALPSVMVSPPTGSICNPGGSPVSLTASGANTYAWSPATGLTPTTGSPVSANPTSSTVYTVTGTDVNGCMNTASSSVVVGSAVSVSSVTAVPGSICIFNNSVFTANAVFSSPTYCPSTHTSGCSGDEITNVVLGSISNPTAGCGGGSHYTYFDPSTGTTTTTLSPGGSPYSLDITFSSDGNQYFGAWIDYNQDGIFAVSEFLGASTNAGANGTTSVIFSIPGTAFNGITRLRIVGGNDNPVTSAQACGVSSSPWGETQDYNVSITGATEPFSYLWSPATFLSSTMTNPTTAVSVTATTMYSVTVTSADGCTATGSTTVTIMGGVHNVNTGRTYCTIQSAINDPLTLNGHKITIDAGTYTENVVVNKELEIQGAGQGLTIVRPASSNPTTNSLGSVIFMVQANNVKIHHLTCDGKNPLITGASDIDASTGIITDWSTGDWTNFEVHHVTVKDVYFRGIEVANNVAATNTFQAHHNTIDGVNGDPFSIGIFNYGYKDRMDTNVIVGCRIAIATNYSFGSKIRGNNITNVPNGTGIESDNNGGGGGGSLADVINGNTVIGGLTGILITQPDMGIVVDIDDNTISGASTGIVVQGGPGSANIHGNTATITGAVIGVDIDGSTVTLFQNNITANGTGVRVINFGNLTSCTENFITNNTVEGIRIEANAGTVGPINDNNLSGNTGFAINKLALPIISATCNWYGSANPPTAAAEVSGNLNYIPFLTNGTDNDADADTGFQPVPGSCNGYSNNLYVNDGSTTGDVWTTTTGNDGTGNGTTTSPFRTIQHAINVAAATGSTVWVDAGTYVENVSINKEIEIKGASQALTIVRPATSAPTNNSLASVIFKVQADNVLIHDLTADGKNDLITGVGDVDASTGIITDWTSGAGEWTNLVVHHVTVRDVFFRGIQATYNLVAPHSFYIHHNTINGVQGHAESIGIFNYGDMGRIGNNTITNCTNGIFTNESFGSTISDNHITALPGGTGIESNFNGADGGTSTPDTITNDTVIGGLTGILIYNPYLVVDVNNNTVTGATTGIALQGGPGSANIHDNDATITGSAIGIDVDGGVASITGNVIYDNGIGVRFTNGGSGTVSDNDFNGPTDNGTDVQCTATALTASITAGPDNSFGGITYGVENLSATDVDARYNYWESASGPGPVGPGTGANVTTKVLFCPWLDAPGGMQVSAVASIAVTETSGILNNDGNICAGASVTLDATYPGATYSWSPGGATTASIMVTPAMTTLYSVTVSYPGCTDVASANIVVNPLPVLGGPTSVCTGQSIQLTPMSGGTWASNNMPVATISASGLVMGVTPGMATFTFTSTAGCSSTTGNVPVNLAPSATITVAPSIYQGSSGNLASVPNAGIGATYLWSLSSGLITFGNGTNSITFNAGTAPSMMVNVTVTKNGCTVSSSVMVNVLVPGPSSMVWQPDYLEDYSCGSVTNCCLDTLCFNLVYTPGVDGYITTYTTGFFGNCLGGMVPLGYNKSCVMNTNNPVVISQCMTIDSFLFNSSGNNGNLVLVNAGVPEILHKACFNVETNESLQIREDIITNLTASIDLLVGGQLTEFPTYMTQLFNKPAPVIPANVTVNVDCPADTIAPVPPEVVDFCGNTVGVTLVSKTNVPSPMTCEGTQVYHYEYEDCSGYIQPWSYTYHIEYLDFTITTPPGGSIVQCPALTNVVPTPPTVMDNCGNVLVPSVSNTGPLLCEGLRFYTFTYTDCEGNTHNWVYGYFVEYEPIPNPVDSMKTVNCPLLANVTPTPPVVVDNCGNVLSPSGPTSTPALLASTCEGSRTFTWNYVDCESNTQDFNYTYTVERQPFTDPTDDGSMVSCPAQTNTVPTPPAAIDNCGNAIVPTGPVVSTIPACEGTRTYTWTYSDCEGNTAQYVYTYTVVRPAFTLPLDDGSFTNCAADANVVPVAPMVTDACSVSLVPVDTIISPQVTCNGFNQTRTYTFVYMDCAGHTLNWVYTYTVNCVPLTLKVFLEGPFVASGDSMRSTLNFNHLLPGQDKTLSPNLSIQLQAPYTPFGQPYNTPPWNYAGTEGGNFGDPSSPGAPMVVIPYPDDIVDWVLVSIRMNGILPMHEIWTCAGLVHTDGEVTFPSICPGLVLTPNDSFYILVKHRTHLGVLTPIAADMPCSGYSLSWDFTLQNSFEPIFRYGEKFITPPGKWVMHDANGEQILSIPTIGSADRNTWKIFQNAYGYNLGDFNMNGQAESGGDESAWKSNQNRSSGILFY